MALTSVTVVAEAGKVPSAPIFINRITAVGPASYTASGEAFDPVATLGKEDTVLDVRARAYVTATGFPSVILWEWDRTNNKLVALTQARAEASGDLSADTIDILVFSQ